jgi:hypothetical protein
MREKERVMRLVLGTAVALMLVVPTARADDPMQLAVVTYGQIPAGSGFETEMFQNTEISNHVDSTLREALAARGFHYRPGGRGLVFAINADRTGRGVGRPPRGSYDPNNAQVHIVLNTADINQPGQGVARGYRINLSVYNRETGRYIWRAEINDLKPDADPFDATKPMVEELMAALQKSVKPAE